MANKRKHPANHDPSATTSPKKSRISNLDGSDDLPSSSQPRVDPTYGQRGAFPGLDDPPDDDALFYGPAGDGLEYLRMVRSEAKTVPNLLVAPSSPTATSKDNDLYADYPQGYYSNGAYTAIPLPPSNPTQAHTNGGQQEDKDPQEAYYASLCARFTEITKTLQSQPPRAAPESTEVYYHEWRQPQRWRKAIFKNAPSMVLLAHHTQESVMCGLEVLESLLTLANLRGIKGKNIGAWTWGLLGRCREVGQMDSEDVGVLRKLGKQAVWLLRRISAGEVIDVALDEEPDVEMGEEDEGDGEGEEEAIEDEAKSSDIADADEGYSPRIDPIATAPLFEDINNKADPIAMVSDAELAEAKQDVLDLLSKSQAQVESKETNVSNEIDITNPTPTHLVREVEVESTRDPTQMADKVAEDVADKISNETADEMADETTNKRADEKADEKAMIHATLDMIVTIIGEFYGQRDLLGGRLLWDEMQ